jgi:regulation of enolase protein 1 (concanavalin A-like superfamily)
MRSLFAATVRHLFALTFCYNLVTYSQPTTFTGIDIGAGSGSTRALTNGFELTSASRDIGGTADSFHFAYQQRTGDFDVQVRLENVTVTDAFVQAGLLAREALDAGTRFVGVFSSSAQIGAFFESRAVASSASAITAPPIHFPANYPQMYLRLRRAGNVFTGYASFDAQTWEQISTTTLALPSSVFFGMGLASHNTNKISTAIFRDLGTVTAPSVGPIPREAEPLGPSNRRAGVVLSEIMFNPPPRLDTNNLEFVEIYNGESIFVDLTGWKITGGIEYQFPAGFQLQAGEFAVVAADPALLQNSYGITGVLGPFTGRLNNSGDTLRIVNASGATRFEVAYESNPPWPVAADGAGHSLVLARPSYGEENPRAWTASELIGGSPGQVDAVRPSPLKAILINEFLAHTDDPVLDFIELYNAGNNSVNLSGCIITDDITTNRFRIPDGTFLAARGHLSFEQTDLGFALSSAGETLYLLSPNSDRVLDSVRFDGQENGVSSGRAPDGSPTIRRLSSPTPGAANAAWKVEDVVINEVMYHPITADDNDQFIELHNRSAAPIDLSGWTFVDGIDFEFPQGATLPAGGYVVVARDAARLLANYPNLTTNSTFGNFDGSLSRSGERIALAKPDFVVETNQLAAVVTNRINIVVSELTYVDGGRWPELADGGGSSLELIDPRADTLRAGSWAASDETAKAPWTSVEVTARLDHGNATYSANRFQIAMLGAGECLVDDIEFIPAGSTNTLVNGSFDLPTNSWSFFGNHRGSAIQSSGAFSGPNVLHVRAPGDGDTANNTIRGNMVRSVTSGTATIRAKVRWLSGWPEVLLRLRGNWIELPARMTVPANLGTPGLANSRRISNSGPAIFDVAHHPPAPRASEPVVVTCRVTDPDGVAAPRLVFRVDPSSTLSTVVMRDDGAAGDDLAGDGLYSGLISGRPSGTLVAFRIQASDDAAASATTVFPPDAPVRECLIRWDDPIPFGNFGHYHMWSTAATESARSSSPDLDNTFRDSTLVYNNSRILYNTGFRDKGSPYHGGSGDFALTVQRDDKLLGVDDRIFASTGNGGSEVTGMKTDVSGWIGQQLGIPYLHSHFMRLYRNGGRYRDVMLDMEQPNRYFAESWFGGGGVKDDLFKISIWFEFDDGNGNFNSTSATLQRFLSDGQFKLARYRWNWQIRPSTDTANDYTSIFNLVTAATSTTERVRTLPLIADMEEWMRVFAYHRIIGNWDSYSYSVGQNMFLYAPLGQRSALLPWDIDFVLGEGDNATASTLFNAPTESTIQSLFGLPVYRRMLYRAYQDAVAGPMVQRNFQPQVDARRNALLKNGINLTAPTIISSYLNSRRTYISNQVVRADAPSIQITSNGGNEFTNSETTVTLTGSAPFALATIEVNGIPFPVTWTSVTNWQITVPLGGRTNVLVVHGRDLRGNLVSYPPDEITVIYNGAVPEARDWVVINEILYNPAEPDAEFIELHNRHPSFAFDLSGLEMSGVGFTFPPGTFIQPNGFLVLVKNRAAFGLVFGATLPVVGPYSGNLQRNGETLRLVQPGATAAEDLTLDEVRYENLPPWPALADGFGPSLQLIDPAQDNARVGNWLATAITDANRATPGRANAGRSALEPFPALWLNEIAPLNLTGPSDSRGEREPWLELYNNGTVTIDLSGLTLSDDPQQLGKWQFPAGSQILPGQFLLVWLDGEPGDATATEFHTSFRLGSTNGLVILSRPQGATAAPIDYLRYQVTSAANTFGSFPDGDPRRRRMLYLATPGAPNNATIPDVNIFINEWMAAAHSVLRDPADGQFEDWFELYNAGTNTVDLSGYFLSDARSQPLFELPAGFQIAPKSFRLVWADNETSQNAAGRDLHVNFSLGAGGEEIALFTPDEQLVDLVVFGEQSSNISEGRFPDGGPEPFALFLTPTPGAANNANFANRPPVITQLADRPINEGLLFTANIAATDPDQPAQQITFTLLNAPSGMTMSSTGQISWQTSEVHGPGAYPVTVRATDNGSPARSATMSFQITVQEVNLPPSITSMPDFTIDEGVPFSFQVQAVDPDFPAQPLSFGLYEIVDIGGPPAGSQIDPRTGEFTWTPTEAQGPGVYIINVGVGDANFVTFEWFNITVRDINNPPVIQEISAQSIPEGSPFTLQVVAADPEQTATLAYTLESAPAGLSIDPNSGLIAWTPAEADGPRDHNVVVRVSEPGAGPTSTVSFIIGVREINNAPTLGPVADLLARPGDIFSLKYEAADSDLPEQLLTFSATGLPLGANLNPVTGVFSWIVPQDVLIATNVITIRVSDDASPSASSEKTFSIVVQAPPRVVINEIMHRPALSGGEYVELANISQFNSVDVSGWRFEGYNYTFPPNTILPPQSFICVARFLTGFQGSYGPVARVYGDATVTLSPEGGIVRLVKPAANGVPEEIIDEVEFSTLLPWPAAQPGTSLQLIDPWEDNRRVSNWSASVQTGASSTTTIFPIGATWRYWQAATPPASTWALPGFSDATWASGAALHYVEDAALPAPKSTPLTLGQTAYYFRGRFNFTGNTNGATIRLSPVLDDGAVFYLNGQEILRIGMPEGVVDENTFASRTVGNAAFEGPFDVPATGLRPGENILSARVHQANSGSSDIVFGAEIQLTTATAVAHTPGAPNSVTRDLPAIPPIWINEVHPINTTGITDAAGEREPWFELHNGSDSPVDIGGWFLSDDLALLAKHQLPLGTVLGPRGYLLVWADAEFASPEIHVPFRLQPTGGALFLSVSVGATATIADYVQYPASTNQSFGAPRDGNPVGRILLSQATPGAANSAPATRPPLTATRQSNSLRITWPSLAGQTYILEATGDLNSPWQSVWTGPGTGAELSYTDANPATRRFYRLRIE